MAMKSIKENDSMSDGYFSTQKGVSLKMGGDTVMYTVFISFDTNKRRRYVHNYIPLKFHASHTRDHLLSKGNLALHCQAMFFFGFLSVNGLYNGNCSQKTVFKNMK